MNFFKLFLTISISQALTESNNSIISCPCSQYSINTCDQLSSCSWNQQNCEGLVCKNRNSTYCYGAYSDYKCIWDAAQNQCKDFQNQKCEEITTSKDCLMSQNNNMDCTWTINKECKNLGCTHDFDCPLYKCSFINGTCSDPINELNCSSIPIEECNYTRNGKGIYCFLNDDVQCQSYNLTTLNCSQWSDNQQGCEIYDCSYQNKICKDKTCHDIQNQEQCNFIYQNDYLNKILCFWSNNQCQNLEQNNIQQISKEDCEKYLIYGWSDNQCQKCDQIKEESEGFDAKWIYISFSIFVFVIFVAIFAYCIYRQIQKRKRETSYQTEIHPIGPLTTRPQ